MKYLYEFIGTFFLVFTVGMTVLGPNGAGPLAPLAIGTILAVMVYAGGHVSGGHYNPAVSLAVFLRGKLESKDLILYWIAQFVAGVLAAYTVIYLKGAASTTPLVLDVTKALLSEFLFTFALCFMVLNVATAKETANNSYFGFAIGFTVLAGAYAVGTISGGAFNPAVALGQSFLNLTSWSDIWVYGVAGILGAFASAYIFKEAHTD